MGFDTSRLRSVVADSRSANARKTFSGIAAAYEKRWKLLDAQPLVIVADVPPALRNSKKH